MKVFSVDSNEIRCLSCFLNHCAIPNDMRCGAASLPYVHPNPMPPRLQTVLKNYVSKKNIQLKFSMFASRNKLRTVYPTFASCPFLVEGFILGALSNAMSSQIYHPIPSQGLPTLLRKENFPLGRWSPALGLSSPDLVGPSNSLCFF